MTDPVTRDYNDRCLSGDDKLLHVMAEARRRFPRMFDLSCGDRLLPRPFFIDEARMRDCAADLIGLFDLLVGLPARLFDGDLGRYCEALGISRRRAALIQRVPGPPDLYGRADLYHDGDSFKLLEFNIDSALGGTDRAEISRLLLETDAFRAFAEEHRLGYVHTGERVAQALRRAAEPVTGGADPVVAFVEEDGGLPKYLHLARSFQEMLGRLGLEVLLTEVSQVRSDGGRLFVDGRKIDVVLRYFTDEDIVAVPDGEKRVEPIFRAHEDGTAVLWTNMRSGQVFNKGCLALLSDARTREALSPEEKALLDRILPWTRIVSTGRTEAGGETVDLLDYCRAHREELILKPHTGYGGDGIIAGWEVSDREWREALAEGVRRDYTVQRRVVPRHEPVVDPETRAVEDWVAAWDAFITPDGYAGSHIRARRTGGGAVINMGAGGAARTTGIFLTPAP